jgi:hypothetical protein
MDCWTRFVTASWMRRLRSSLIVVSEYVSGAGRVRGTGAAGRTVRRFSLPGDVIEMLLVDSKPRLVVRGHQEQTNRRPAVPETFDHPVPLVRFETALASPSR